MSYLATTDRPTADTAVLVYWQWTPPVCMRIGFTYMREEWSDAGPGPMQ